MPTGKVKWFDVDKGFGFLSSDDGPDVYVHADALPQGAAKNLRKGTRVEYGIAQGRRGEQALSVKILEPARRLSRQQAAARRRNTEDMVPIVEDVTKLLEGIGEGYRGGRHPDPKMAQQVAVALRALADEFDLSR